MNPESDWLLLSEAFDRLAADAVNDSDIICRARRIDAAREIIGCGQVPIIACSDLSNSQNRLASRVEALLAKAIGPRVGFASNEIIGRFRANEMDPAIFGPECSLVFPQICFSGVRVHWPELVEALAAAGFAIIAADAGEAGGTSGKQLAWQIALEILSDDARRPARGQGRLMALARLINVELARRGHRYQDDSIRKLIQPSLREWEDKHPDW